MSEVGKRLLAAVGVLSLAPIILPRVELNTTQAFGFGWCCACLVVFGRIVRPVEKR